MRFPIFQTASNWYVGDCSISTGYPFEISAGSSTTDCVCGSDAYTVRPCIGNNNWGGVLGDTCGATAQTLEVLCEY